MIKILLLDCKSKVKRTLEEKGFAVSEGTLGFGDGLQNIPVALYEQNIIIFNPTDVHYASKCSYKTEGFKTIFEEISNKTPGVTISDLEDFFKRGGILVTFVRDFGFNDERKETGIYSWIPKFPLLLTSLDREIQRTIDPNNEKHIPFISLFRDFRPAFPIKKNLLFFNFDYVYPEIFLTNLRRNIIACSYVVENGLVVVLPHYDNDTELISHFICNTYFKIFEIKPDIPAYLDLKKSSLIQELEKQKAEQESAILENEKKIESINEKMTKENNRVENIIKKDETALKIMGYLDDELMDKNESWYPAYKITETLIHYYNDIEEAKTKLGASVEINYIRKIANQSNRDTRHSPKPGEAKSPPSEEEIKKILEYSIELVKKYIGTLL